MVKVERTQSPANTADQIGRQYSTITTIPADRFSGMVVAGKSGDSLDFYTAPTNAKAICGFEESKFMF